MTDLIPAARPVPSPEDRMAAARTDTPPTTDPAPKHPGRSFRTWMSDTDRDQLDAEVGRLQGELDEMRDARDVAKQLADFRQGVIDRHRQELGAAGEVLAVVRDAAERIDRALAVYDTTPEGTTAATADEVEFGCPRLAAVLDGRVNGVHSAATCGSCAELRNGRAAAPSSVPSRRMQEEPACTCYPSGFSPGTYEGPMRDCPVHGELPAEARP